MECTHVISVWTLLVSIRDEKREFKDILGSFEQSTRVPGASGMFPTEVGEVSFYSLCKGRFKAKLLIHSCFLWVSCHLLLSERERWVYYIPGNICSYTFQVTNGVARASHGAVVSRCHLEPLSCSQSCPLIRFRQILWTCQNTLTCPSVSNKLHRCQGTFSRCIWLECMCCAGPWELFQDNGSFSKGWPFDAVRDCTEHAVLWMPSPVRNRAGSRSCRVQLPSLGAYWG